MEIKKIHDIETLLVEASGHNKTFMESLDLGRKLTVFYYENRYPPGFPPEISEGEVEEILREAEKVIGLIKKETEL